MDRAGWPGRNVVEGALPEVFLILLAFFMVIGAWDACTGAQFAWLSDRLFLVLLALCACVLVLKRSARTCESQDM